MTLIGYPSLPKFTQGYSRLPKVAQGSPRIPNVTLGYLRMQFHKLAYSPTKLHLVSLRLPQERSKTDLIPALAPEVTDTLLFKRQTESRSHQSRASEILMMQRMT